MTHVNSQIRDVNAVRTERKKDGDEEEEEDSNSDSDSAAFAAAVNKNDAIIIMIICYLCSHVATMRLLLDH